jgi:hypothetical protein
MHSILALSDLYDVSIGISNHTEHSIYLIFMHCGVLPQKLMGKQLTSTNNTNIYRIITPKFLSRGSTTPNTCRFSASEATGLLVKLKFKQNTPNTVQHSCTIKFFQHLDSDTISAYLPRATTKRHIRASPLTPN